MERPVKTTIVRFENDSKAQAEAYCEKNPYFHVQSALGGPGYIAVYNHMYYKNPSLKLEPNFEGYSDVIKEELNRRGYLCYEGR